MKRLIPVILLALGLSLPLVRLARPVPELVGLEGDFPQVLESIYRDYGPFEEELVLDDGASFRSQGLSFEVYRDNFLGNDFLLFISK